MSPTTLDLLTDSRTGLLTEVHRQPRDPRMPAGWVSSSAQVARADRWASWRPDGFGFGASLGDEQAARAAAVGEAVERYCGNAVPDDLRHATWHELTAAGEDALDPTSLALYSPRQHAQPGFPFVPFTRDLRVAWVPGSDLRTDEAVWVPATLAYLDYRHGSRAGEPPVHSLVYSGIATGADRVSAQRSALEELLERDACTIWWASGAPARLVDDGDLVVGRLGQPGQGSQPQVRLLHIPSELGVPVVAAFLEAPHPDGPAGHRHLAFGAACRADPAAAAAKALTEALGLLQLTRQLDDPTSDVWRAVEAGEIERHVFLPHRPDRSYRRLAGEDYRELTDLPPIAQLYLDPAMQSAPLDRLRPTDAVRLDALSAAVPGEHLEGYLEPLAARGIRVVSVDLTTPDVAAAGLTVVRVIAPGLVGNAPPAFPLRGGRRLYTVPAALGWASGELDEDDLVRHPLPLA
jgi:ribosomal protein S12 methylthiotransferase accessory factor